MKWLRGTIAWCLVAAATPTHAAMICRWTDASGRTQLADTVPDRYAQSAKCTDSAQFEVPPERARQAQERARKLRQQADIGNAPNAAASMPAARASAASGKRPVQGVDASTDCAQQRKLYQESAACFAPYRTVGGTKAEAFDKCRVIPAPDPKCGAVVN